jgi:Predicted transcriptional regulators
MKSEIKKLYYSIGEVSKMVDLKSYVLRYWETEFKQLAPPKNRAGNRTYRQKDIDLVFQIKDLLYNKKYTIEGARSMLSSKSGHKKSSVSKSSNTILILRKELEKIISIINE